MRLMFVTAPASGHFFPLVPLADEAKTRGHDVLFATTDTFCAAVGAAGHRAEPFGADRGVIPPEVLDHSALDGLIELARRWAPDVLVHDHTMAPAAIAADTVGLPNAYSSVGIMRSPRMMHALARHWLRLWDDRGLEMPEALGLHRYLYLDRCPPSLQPEAIKTVPTAHPVRPVSWDGASGTGHAAAFDGPNGRPRIYVTLGTEFNSVAVMATILRSISDEAVEIVATIGNNRDPRELEPQPSNVRVEQYLPQSVVLQTCDVMISHGGSGAIMGSLAAGVPMLLLPQGADQVDNSPRCVARGVARSIEQDAMTQSHIRDELWHVVSDPSYKAAARAVAAEIQAMPGVDHAVDLVEVLARTGRPVSR